MNLNDLFRLLRRFRFVALIVVLVWCWPRAPAIALSSPEPLRVDGDRRRRSPTVTGGQIGSVQNIDFLIPQYLARLDSPSSDRPPPPRCRRSVQDAPISVDQHGEPGTGIINIQVTSTDKAAVAPWANALANTLVTAVGQAVRGTDA